MLASAGRDMVVRVWDVDGSRLLMPPLEGHGGIVLGLAFAPAAPKAGSGAPLIVSGSLDATVRLWPMGTGWATPSPASGHSQVVSDTEARGPGPTSVVLSSSTRCSQVGSSCNDCSNYLASRQCMGRMAWMCFWFPCERRAPARVCQARG